jgi:hypothetical protein
MTPFQIIWELAEADGVRLEYADLMSEGVKLKRRHATKS